jgi:hypothetical protein
MQFQCTLFKSLFRCCAVYETLSQAHTSFEERMYTKIVHVYIIPNKQCAWGVLFNNADVVLLVVAVLIVTRAICAHQR